MKRILAIGVILLFIGMSLSSSAGLNLERKSIPLDSKTLYVGGSGPGNYTKIQNAIDDASDGDTVYVYSSLSLYYEHIVVYKSINLIGEDKKNTVVDGGKSGRVVHITADGVTVSGFTLQNSGNEWIDAGIYISSNNNNISGNIIKNNFYGVKSEDNFYNNTIINNIITYNNDDGIRFEKLSDCTINENTIVDNKDNGIYLGETSNCVINGNTISNNIRFGLELDFSEYMVITNNIFLSNGIRINYGLRLVHWNSHTIENNIVNGRPIRYYKNTNDVVVPSDSGQIILANCSNFVIQDLNFNEYVGTPIILGFSTYNTISKNNILNNRHAIEIAHSSNNIISENEIENIFFSGIALYYSTKNTITENIITKCNERGIGLWGSHKNVVTENIVRDKSYQGLLLYSSWQNKVTKNTFTNNTYGIESWDNCRYNLFCQNNFFENKEFNAFDRGAFNLWFNILLLRGNYWDDYEGNDIFPPWGRGDKPYDIPGTARKDRFPLMKKYTDSSNSNTYSQYTVSNKIQEFVTSSDSQYNQMTEDILLSSEVVGDNNYDRDLDKVSSGSVFLKDTIYVDDDNTEGPWDGSIEHPYQFIQDGIDAARRGDTVFVFNGTYYGYIEIKKKLSINLIGENQNTTIIRGGILVLFTRGLSISCFRFQPTEEFWQSLAVLGSSKCTITNNTFEVNGFMGLCIEIGVVFDCTISYNTFLLNGHDSLGIGPVFSFKTVITNNIFIANNNIEDTEGINAGVFTFNSIISDNFFSHIDSAIFLGLPNRNNVISNNTITHCEVGITLYETLFRNVISGNNISCFKDVSFGIALLFAANRNIVCKNTISNAGENAIWIMGSFGNKIIANNIIDNYKGGIWVADIPGIVIPYNNRFYYNNFERNGLGWNAQDDSIDLWYNPILRIGNYWDDYKERGGYDDDGDGIGDVPYNFPTNPIFNKDRYPLMSPVDIQDVEIKSVINDIINEDFEQNNLQNYSIDYSQFLDRCPLLSRLLNRFIERWSI